MYVDSIRNHHVCPVRGVCWRLSAETPPSVCPYFAVSRTFLGVSLWAVGVSPQPMTARRVQRSLPVLGCRWTKCLVMHNPAGRIENGFMSHISQHKEPLLVVTFGNLASVRFHLLLQAKLLQQVEGSDAGD